MFFFHVYVQITFPVSEDIPQENRHFQVSFAPVDSREIGNLKTWNDMSAGSGRYEINICYYVVVFFKVISQIRIKDGQMGRHTGRQLTDRQTWWQTVNRQTCEQRKCGRINGRLGYAME